MSRPAAGWKHFPNYFPGGGVIASAMPARFGPVQHGFYAAAEAIGRLGPSAPERAGGIPTLGSHGLFEHLENQGYVYVGNGQIPDSRLGIGPERFPTASSV